MKIIDFHAHILPGADHGSASVEETLAQLALLRGAGVDAVVATPHFYPHRKTVKEFCERRIRAEAALAAVLPSDAPAVYVGAEVLLCSGMDRLEGIRHLTIAGTDVILLEMPRHTWGEDLLDTIDRIRDDLGLKPVIAHPDRYPYPDTERLIRRGYDLQLNAQGVTALFPRTAGRCLRAGRVVAIGSDLHEADSRGAARFARAIRRLGGNAEVVMSCTADLLAGAVALTADKEVP